ncbi:MAG: dCMP deaminase family protein [Rickettsiales bacterium]|jgi:dCMP deaminase|nr:dCMP deaminase family protein [Rickettsiales bacterium]
MVLTKKFTFSEKWNLRFMNLAKEAASWSKDESTKVGCVAVGPRFKEVRSIGYNGFPRGVNDDIPERHTRPTKYEFTAHAEQNVISNASICGVSLCDCIAFITMPPCTRCAGEMIQAGIKEVIFLSPPEDERSKIAGWRENLKYSFEMFDEAGVLYKPLNNSPNIEAAPAVLTIAKLFNKRTLNKLSDNLIRVNGLNFQASICMEELTEFVTELLLNNSFGNTSDEAADYVITRNHIVRGYDIGKAVNDTRTKKLLNPNFMQTDGERIVAFLNMQKELLKNVNRRKNNLQEIINKTADADVAFIKSVIDRNNYPQIRALVDYKTTRTIQREFIDKSREYQ